MNYYKSTQLKEAFKQNVFKLFTDAVGGDLDEFTDTVYNKFTIEDFAYHDDMYYWGMIDYFQKKVIPHKIAVYQAGIELTQTAWFNINVSDQEKKEFIYNLWLHDISKFSAAEAFGYAMYNRQTGHGNSLFKNAWHHHKMANPHHPEHWYDVNREGTATMMVMPVIYVLEMVADWIGAGKTYGTPLDAWLTDNLHKFRFGCNKSAVMNVLDSIGIQTWIHEGNILKTIP